MSPDLHEPWDFKVKNFSHKKEFLVKNTFFSIKTYLREIGLNNQTFFLKLQNETEK